MLTCIQETSLSVCVVSTSPLAHMGGLTQMCLKIISRDFLSLYPALCGPHISSLVAMDAEETHNHNVLS